MTKREQIVEFNQYLRYLNTLNNDLYSLFDKKFNIQNELSIIHNFLDDYYYLAKNRIILLLCALYEDHETGSGRFKQLSSDYFMIDTNEELVRELGELRCDHRFEKIEKYRDKLLGHFDFDSMIKGKEYIDELGLFNSYIYSFTQDTIKFANKLNEHYNINDEDFTVINPTSQDLIYLADTYKIAKELDIATLKEIKNNDPKSYENIKSSIESMIEKSGL